MLRGSETVIVWVEEDQGPKAGKRRKMGPVLQEGRNDRLCSTPRQSLTRCCDVGEIEISIDLLGPLKVDSLLRVYVLRRSYGSFTIGFSSPAATRQRGDKTG
jgi:hypothetical protein